MNPLLKAWLKHGERELDILGEVWMLKVEPKPRMIKGLPQHGECCWQDKYIYVWKTGDLQRDTDTLIHEMLHAIRMTLGMESKEDSGWPEKDYETEKEEHAAIVPVAFGLAYILTHNEVGK